MVPKEESSSGRIKALDQVVQAIPSGLVSEGSLQR